ncbi:uncharacterized protein PFL1_04828 [Pseudozyma flocculosa PF-1]|uniref:BTB domain-containing protein n=2 Tax=Pseudozyma flocculosa TaxID=84751 RepID=A0A5C3F5D4_9BASI|nr:uncharacterized protein PFL1_04828 [Pseudozyma flocculosa PF-1]EPQ27690.1 hypothetical protein PFL1_04828 [Pseudozyma flocculosa PF-1]SPO39176.1 uncharacterized protein PSFLO_04655 [Pseudozyma flocculosa]
MLSQTGAPEGSASSTAAPATPSATSAIFGSAASTTLPVSSASSSSSSSSSSASAASASAPAAPHRISPAASSQAAPASGFSSLLPRSSSSASTASNSGASTPTAARMSSSGFGRTTAGTTSPRRASSSLAGSSRPAQSAFQQRRISHHPPSASSSSSASVSTATALSSTDGTNAVPSIFGALSSSSQHAATSSHRAAQAVNHNFHDSLRGSVGGGLTASPRMAGNGLPSYMHQARGSAPWDQGGGRGVYQLLSTTQQDATNLQLQPTFEEHSLVSFSWTIRDVHLLRDEVERTPPPSMGGRSVSAGAGKSDVWATQPVFGEGKWRLELVRTQRRLDPASQEPVDPTQSDDPAASTAAFASEQQPEQSSEIGQGDAEAADDDDPEGSLPRSDSITVLSVYLTSILLDYSHSDVEITTSIMVGVRPAREPIGRRGSASGGWCWRGFYDFCFHREQHFFQCHDLPSISELLQNDVIRNDDAFTLTVQLNRLPTHAPQPSPAGATTSFMPPFEAKGAHLVPRSVLDSLQGLLDDANTGDVRVVVRERGLFDRGDDPAADARPYPIGLSMRDNDDHANDTGVEAEVDDSSEHWQPSVDKVCVRDRVLWAHSSILKNRSDYFKTMLASNFSEGQGQTYPTFGGGGGGGPHRRETSGDVSGVAMGGRSVRTLRIADADYVTAYWFLRFLYTEDIEFAENEDVRGAVLDEDWAVGSDPAADECDGSLGDGGSVAQQGSRFLRDWTPLSEVLLLQEEEASRSSTPLRHPHHQQQQHDSGQARFSKHATQGTRYTSYADTFPRMPHAPASHHTLSTRASEGMLAATSARGGGGTGGGGEAAPPSPSPSLHLDSSMQHQPHAGGSGQGQVQGQVQVQGHGSGNSNNNNQVRVQAATLATLSSDPHEHPASPPGPASAFNIFRLAHRFCMADLLEVASAHLVASLTPASAFPLLLATSVYADLHDQVKRFVYAHWESVANSTEFERCCDEVGRGEWGPEAGRALRLFMKSLVSPARVVPAAPGRS